MCLYEMLCDYLGATLFDVKLLALTLFSNICIHMILNVLFPHLRDTVDSYSAL